MQNLSLTEQDKIEAFCRELAQSLRQITGRQAEPTEEELTSLASRVTAKPIAPASDQESTSQDKSRPATAEGTNGAHESPGAKGTQEKRRRAKSSSNRGKRRHNAQ
jgi:hypothetical protein